MYNDYRVIGIINNMHVNKSSRDIVQTVTEGDGDPDAPCGLFQDTRIYESHWGRVTLICVGNLTIIGSDNGLSPDRRQAIT